MKINRPLLYILLGCILVAVTVAAEAPSLTIKCSDVKVKGAEETDS